MAYATVADLAARWRPLSPAEQDRAAVLLDDVAVLIDEAAPLAPAPYEPTTVELGLRLIVSVDSVRRAMVAGSTGGGEGVTSVQQGAGPYQETVQYANPMGNLYLHPGDVKRLRGGDRQRAFTVDLLAGHSVETPEWS